MKKISDHHERMSEDDEVKPPSDRSFGITFSVLFLIVALLPLFHGDAVRGWALVASAVLAAFAFFFPSALRPPNLLWLKFGLLLHRIVNPIVLGAMFILVVTPMAIFIRLSGKKLLQPRYEPGLPSYWTRRDPPGPEPDSIRRQF